MDTSIEEDGRWLYKFLLNNRTGNLSIVVKYPCFTLLHSDFYCSYKRKVGEGGDTQACMCL